MKLNKVNRAAIVVAAMSKAGIDEKRALIRLHYAQWAEEVRLRYVTPEQQCLIEAAETACRQISGKLVYNGLKLNRDKAIDRANIAGQTRTVYYDGSLKYVSGETEKIETRVTPSGVILLGTDPLTEKLYEIDRWAANLEKEIEQLSASLWAVLNSVSTDKKLIEIWPEALAFIPAAEKANTPQLPALPIADLNKMLGLP